MGMKPRTKQVRPNIGIQIDAGPNPEGVRAVKDTVEMILSSEQDQVTMQMALHCVVETVKATSHTQSTITNNVIRMGDDASTLDS